MNWHRRRVVAATIGAGMLAGCLGEDDTGADEDDESESDEDGEGDDNGSDGNEVIDWDPTDRDVEEYLEVDEFVDRTDEDPVSITVDPDGDGFDPRGFDVDSRSIVEWTWEGESDDIYPIAIPEPCDWRGQAGEFEAGDSWDRLFWAAGTYVYGSRDADGEEFTGAFRVHDTEDEDDGDDE